MVPVGRSVTVLARPNRNIKFNACSFSGVHYQVHAVGTSGFAQTALRVYVGLFLSFILWVLTSGITVFSTLL